METHNEYWTRQGGRGSHGRRKRRRTRSSTRAQNGRDKKTCSNMAGVTIVDPLYHTSCVTQVTLLCQHRDARGGVIDLELTAVTELLPCTSLRSISLERSIGNPASSPEMPTVGDGMGDCQSPMRSCSPVERVPRSARRLSLLSAVAAVETLAREGRPGARDADSLAPPPAAVNAAEASGNHDRDQEMPGQEGSDSPKTAWAQVRGQTKCNLPAM